jgi:hypothetical protein
MRTKARAGLTCLRTNKYVTRMMYTSTDTLLTDEASPEPCEHVMPKAGDYGPATKAHKVKSDLRSTGYSTSQRPWPLPHMSSNPTIDMSNYLHVPVVPDNATSSSSSRRHSTCHSRSTGLPKFTIDRSTYLLEEQRHQVAIRWRGRVRSARDVTDTEISKASCN